MKKPRSYSMPKKPQLPLYLREKPKKRNTSENRIINYIGNHLKISYLIQKDKEENEVIYDRDILIEDIWIENYSIIINVPNTSNNNNFKYNVDKYDRNIERELENLSKKMMNWNKNLPKYQEKRKDYEKKINKYNDLLNKRKREIKELEFKKIKLELEYDN